jgi:hypothetical protein
LVPISTPSSRSISLAGDTDVDVLLSSDFQVLAIERAILNLAAIVVGYQLTGR